MSTRPGYFPLLVLLLLPWIPARAQPSRQKQPVPRTDRHGDPLPPGAIARLGTVRWRSEDGVLALAYSPGGKTLLSVGYQSLTQWDPVTGKRLRRIPFGHPDDDLLAVSPDHERVAVGRNRAGGDFRAEPLILLLDTRTGKSLHAIPTKGVHPGGVISAAFSPDGQTLASRGWDTPLVVLWDAATGRRLRQLGKPHPDPPDLPNGLQPRSPNLAYSADGKRLAAASLAGEVRVWDVVSGDELFRDVDRAGRITSVALSPRGKVVAWGNEHGAVRWRPLSKGGALCRTAGPRDGATCLAFSPDERVLIAATYDGTILSWEVATGRQTLRTDELPYPVGCMALAPDGKTLATGVGHAVRMLDLPTGRWRLPFGGHSGPVHEVALSAGGATLASHGHGGTIRLWDLVTGKELPPHPVHYDSFALSPDGRLLATPDLDGTMRLWDVRQGEERRRLRSTATAPALGVSALSLPHAPFCGPLACASLLGGGHRGLLCGGYSPVGFSAGGKLLVATTADGRAVAWRTATGEELPYLAASSREVLAYQIQRVRDPPPFPRPYGVQIRDAARRKVVANFRLSFAGHSQPAFSPDGKTIALAQWKSSPKDGAGEKDEGSLTLWEVATGTPRRRYPAVPGTIRRLTFSPDGRLLACCGDDGRVRLLDAATGEELYSSPREHGPASSLGFSADGRILITGREDTTVLLWDLGALLPARKARRAAPLPPRRLEDLWAELIAEDGVRAYNAILALAAAPRQSVPFLQGRLRPVTAPAEGRVRQWIADLDSPRYPVRVQATAELVRRRDFTAAPLRRALAEPLSLEARRRVQQVLLRVEQPVPPAEEVRVLRALEALERMAVPEALRVLQWLAGGAAEARVTQAARSAAERLAEPIRWHR